MKSLFADYNFATFLSNVSSVILSGLVVKCNYCNMVGRQFFETAIFIGKFEKIIQRFQQFVLLRSLRT